MAVMDSLVEGFSQSMGNIERAVIVITDNRGRQIKKEDHVEIQPNSSVGLIRAFAVSLMEGAEGISPVSVIEAALENVQSPVQLPPRVSVPATTKIFHVKFNPNELTLSGQVAGGKTKTDFSKGKTIGYGVSSDRITMSVKLIFDKVDPQDAFMADKLTLSASSAVTGLIKANAVKKGKKDYSVQKEIEGFLAALRSPDTRDIVFHWGKMSYSGLLERVSAQYTMFNVTGQPVRGVVNLTLLCVDSRVSPASMGVWQAQYDAAFQNQNQSYVKTAQKVGNLINFNL